MPLPLRITFRNIRSSDAVERSVGKHLVCLGRFSDRIMGCRVVVEVRHRVGDCVCFHEEAGEKRPQASTVRIAENPAAAG